jgi:putative sterol carrier protein
MAVQAQDIINAMPGAFQPAKAGSTKALIQMNLTGEGGGQWVIDVADGKCQVRQEVAPKPDTTVTMSAGDFAGLYQNQLNPMQAFMSGKIKVTGNVGLVMQLMNWFER